MELSTRLQAVADWVPKGARLADIGTDHGFLPVWLVKYGIIDFAIAADLREKPLETAKHSAARHGLSDKISFRLCDGLADIKPEEVDTVSIAGMGGETIVSILKAAPWTLDRNTRLLLQPQSASNELRSFLCEKGYRILRETIAREENRFYILIEAEAGVPEPLTIGELWAGKNYNHPQRGAYLDWLSGVLGKAAKGMQKSPDNEQEAKQLLRVIEDLQRMKREWEKWQSP
jgi:tRNA (adenine22-N1)-methyltransferase